MRKYFIVLASLAVAGCMVSEISEETVYVNVDYPTYTAAFDDESTKVYVDTDLKMHWNAGDEISIFRTTGNQRYSFDGADGDREGTFSVQGNPQGGSELQTAYAVYPYSDNTSINTDGVITLNLPEVQHYAENSFGLGANTMVAVTESIESDKLYFKNLCGYLVVKLYGEGTIKSITLTGNNGEKLSGQATVVPVYGEAPVLTMSESAGTSITLDCGEGVALESTAENATAFWFAVPPVTFTQGFTIEVTDGALCTTNKETSIERTIVRNVINSLQSLQINQTENQLAMERDALIAIYNALDGDNWKNNTNWCSNEPVSEWYGVEVDASGHVLGLNLNRNNLNGVLPDEVWSLSSIIWLNFDQNPNLSGELSERISNLTELTSLSMECCNISGKLPKNMSQCESLAVINLQGNSITGNIPKEYASLFNRLSFCLLGGNSLHGEIPQEIMDSEYFIHAWADITVQNAFTFPQKMIVPHWEANDIYGAYISSSIYAQNRLTLMVNCAWLNNVEELYPIYSKYHSKGLEIISFDFSSYAGSEADLKQQAENANLPWPCFYASEAFDGKQRNWSTYPTCGYMGGGWTLVNSDGEVVESNYLGGWGAVKNTIQKEFSDDTSVHFSSDYSQHLQCEYLQVATKGEGIPIVLMGDGYSDLAFSNGKYMNDMHHLYNSLFSVEPFASFKDYFTVSVIKLVSMVDGFDSDFHSALDCHYYGSSIGLRDYTTIFQTVRYGIGDHSQDGVIAGVLLNSQRYAGRCYLNPRRGEGGIMENGLAFALFSGQDENTIEGLVHHEVLGHGFAKLADEYAYEANGAVEQDVINMVTEQQDAWGWWNNIDFTCDPSQVRWSKFINDERYIDEEIGCYEGGYTYWTGVWRPTENSIMRYNTGGFNAPSRYAIWYRINKLAYGDSWNGTYEDFVEYDAVNRTPAAVARRNARRNCVEKNLPPLAPPVVVGHSWRDAK